MCSAAYFVFASLLGGAYLDGYDMRMVDLIAGVLMHKLIVWAVGAKTSHGYGLVNHEMNR